MEYTIKTTYKLHDFEYYKDLWGIETEEELKNILDSFEMYELQKDYNIEIDSYITK